MLPQDEPQSDALHDPPEEQVLRRLPPLLRRAWYSLNQAFRRRIAHLDLTPDQYTVLRNLHEAGSEGITQSELATNMSSDPNTVASLVDRMERAELLSRQTDPEDRRARRLRLAPAGRKKYRAARSLANTLQTEVLAPLSPPETEQFLTVLEKIAAACRKAAEKD
jgi:DNA-binding MarR family transcriptional regulator